MSDGVQKGKTSMGSSSSSSRKNSEESFAKVGPTDQPTHTPSRAQLKALVSCLSSGAA